MRSQICLENSSQYKQVQGSLESLKAPLPLFLHKWTAQVRRFVLDEVSLPRFLFCDGQQSVVEAPLVIGIGGTRSPTAKSFSLVRDFVEQLALKNAAIISGGVPGVDLAAHLAAADNLIGNFAVLANPAEMGMTGHEWHSRILEQTIRKGGCFLSEYAELLPLDSGGFRERLLQRDRIISGLSNAFVAFECSVGSATVDTARRALVQGKHVFAINSDSKSSRKGFLELCQIPGVTCFDPKNVAIETIAENIIGRIVSS